MKLRLATLLGIGAALAALTPPLRAANHREAPITALDHKADITDVYAFMGYGAGSAGKAGGNPEPGGGNRFQIETDDLDAMVAHLREKGASFRGDAAEGPGGRAILLLDPSGNPIELFERAT